MQPIGFFRHDHVFCEAKIYSEFYSHDQPEYINSVTSLFISWIGIFGIINNKRATNDILGLYTSFIVNGICSCAYHFTHYIGWGLADRMSMIVISIYCCNIFIRVFTVSNVSGLFIHFIRLIFTSYILILLVCAGLHNESQFNTLFGAFLVSLVMFVRFIHTVHGRHELANRGLAYMISAGVLWIVTEGLCKQYWIMKYLLGHAMWHIGISLGGYFISVAAISILIDNIKIDYRYGIPFTILRHQIVTSENKFEI